MNARTHLPRTIGLLLLLHGGLVGTGPAHADAIYLKGGQTVFGRVVSQRDDAIIFDQRVGRTTEYRNRTILKSEILQVVVNIQPARLEALTPDRPREYRDLAEELAPQKLDPEAQDLALRLYLIAAYLGDAGLRRDALRGMIRLARSPQEEMRIRGLANVVASGESWLTHPPEPAQPTAEAEIQRSRDRKRLKDALVALRTGKRADAAFVIGQEWVPAALRPYASICTWRQLREWSSEPELQVEWLARTLELELALDETVVSGFARSSNSADWSQLVNQDSLLTTPPGWANVLEFDPAENVYRSGSWSRAR